MSPNLIPASHSPDTASNPEAPKMLARKTLVLCAGAAALLTAVPSLAQAPGVTVTSMTSTVNCSVYVSFWGNWILSVCNRQFPDMRQRLASAVTEALRASESGMGLAGRALTMTGRISGISGSTTTSAGPNFCLSDQSVFATLDWRIEGLPGTSHLAGTTEKSVNTGFDIATGGGVGPGSCNAGQASMQTFDRLQTEISRAAARQIALTVTPMRVTAVDERGRIRLNYGAPVLQMGMQVSVGGQLSMPVRYRVLTSGAGFSWAEPYGARGDVRPGERATVIEMDSAEANARRTDYNPLP
jgi:hypothetical protein